MANAATPIIPRDGVLTASDNTGTPKTWVMLYRGGDLKISGMMPGQLSQQEFSSCGEVYAGRKVDRTSLDVEFTADSVHFIGDGTTATFGDVFLQLGAWSSAVSMLPTTAGDLYCLKLAFAVERSNFGATADNTVTLKYVYGVTDWTEGSPSKFSFKGKAMAYSTDYLTIA